MCHTYLTRQSEAKVRYSASSRNLSYWLFKDKIPVTKTVLICNIVTYVVMGIFQAPAILRYFGFITPLVLSNPWTAFTYPLIGIGAAWCFFGACFWLWLAGGSLERSWGSQRFGIFFFANAAITAAGIYLGALIFRVDLGLAGLWMPLAGLTMAFAMLNPEEQIMFYFVIPLKMKYLALIDIVLVLMQYKLPLGLFGLAGCVFGFLYVRKPRLAPRRAYRTENGDIRVHLPHSRGSWLNPAGWYNEYKDRRRLKKFLGKSNFPDV
jgi:membrane associated rhomboid family serine protease